MGENPALIRRKEGIVFLVVVLGILREPTDKALNEKY